MASVLHAFTAGEVVRLAQVTYRELAHWVKVGLIKPEKNTQGTGDHRLFDFRNVVEARVIKELRSRGISLQKVRRCVEFLRQHLPEGSRPLSQELLLTDGVTVYWCRTPQEVIDTLKRGQMVFAIFIGDLWDRLEKEAAPLVADVGRSAPEARMALDRDKPNASVA